MIEKFIEAVFSYCFAILEGVLRFLRAHAYSHWPWRATAHHGSCASVLAALGGGRDLSICTGTCGDGGCHNDRSRIASYPT